MSDSQQNYSDIQQQVFDDRYKIVHLPVYTYPKVTIILQVPCILYKNSTNQDDTEWIPICKGFWKYLQCNLKNYIICVDSQTKHLRINIHQQKIIFTQSLFIPNSWQFEIQGVKYTLQLTDQNFQLIEKRNQSLQILTNTNNQQQENNSENN